MVGEIPCYSTCIAWESLLWLWLIWLGYLPSERRGTDVHVAFSFSLPVIAQTELYLDHVRRTSWRHIFLFRSIKSQPSSLVFAV